MSYNIILQSIAMDVPEKVVTNDDLIKDFLINKKIFSSTIEKLTGIKKRHFVNPEDKDAVANMAVKSILEAVQGMDFGIDGLFYVGNTLPTNITHNKTEFKTSDVCPENIAELIPDAHQIMKELHNDKRFGRMAIYPSLGGCAHFLSALFKAYDYIKKGDIETAVVATSTDISRCLDFADRKTSILFGDGACAALLRKGEDGPRIFAYYEDENFSLDHLLYYERIGNKWYVRMPDGNAVSREAINAIGRCFENMEARGHTVENIDHFIFHQANGQILDKIAEKYEIPKEKIHKTVDKYGNTSSASIGITLCEALNERKIKEGQKVLLVGFGAGFRWNYVVVQY